MKPFDTVRWKLLKAIYFIERERDENREKERGEKAFSSVSISVSEGKSSFFPKNILTHFS